MEIPIKVKDATTMRGGQRVPSLFMKQECVSWEEQRDMPAGYISLTVPHSHLVIGIGKDRQFTIGFADIASAITAQIEEEKTDGKIETGDHV